jgi:hypothetical protein
MASFKLTSVRPFPMIDVKRLAKLSASACFISILLACGGGNSTSDVVGSITPDSTTPPTGISTPIDVVPLIITPGAYAGTLSGKDWVTILMRSQQGAGATSQFLSLYYNTVDPDIFSGSGLIAGVESAALAKVMLFQNTLSSVRIGTGTVSKTSANALTANLSFPATSSELAKSIAASGNMPAAYQYNLAPAQASIQGTWQGRWSYGMGSSDNFSLFISSQGLVSTSLTFQQDCRITQSTLLPNFDGTNLFAWNLVIPNATLCSFKSQTLTGAAFVTASPVAGKTQRLYAVAISPDGRGVSFKADR